MEASKSNKPIEIIRWIVFIPGAVLGAWLSFDLFYICIGVSLGIDPEPDSFMDQFLLQTFSNAARGAAFVYIGVQISPYYQKNVAYVLAGLGLILSGFFLFKAILVGSGWAIWGAVCQVIGIGAVTYFIHQGEIDLGYISRWLRVTL